MFDDEEHLMLRVVSLRRRAANERNFILLSFVVLRFSASRSYVCRIYSSCSEICVVYAENGPISVAMLSRQTRPGSWRCSSPSRVVSLRREAKSRAARRKDWPR